MKILDVTIFYDYIVIFGEKKTHFVFKGIQAVILIKKKCFPISNLNFDLKKHKDILQLKFFIISYVNSLERRKYVAV
jgi:hypothetical protein